MTTDFTRPRVSRETRRLLAAAGLALLALWILARLRFPERPTSPNPVSPVLTQISPPTRFADLAAETARIEQRIMPLLSVVTWQPSGEGNPRAFPAWPWRDDLAIAMLPPALAAPVREDISAIDRSTGLALVRLTRPETTAPPLWTPERLEIPRYFFAAIPAPSRPAITPVYVSSLEPLRSPAWPSEIWKLTAAGGLPRGAMVFTAAAEWLGIATLENGEPVIVPAAALVALSAQLSQLRPAPGEIGLQIQHLDAKLGAHLGVPADSGVVVTWVDPRGAAADILAVGDVIETVNGARTPTVFAWQVHSTRLVGGAQATLQVRRAGALQDFTLVVPPRQPVRASPALGLTLAPAPGLGSRITQVAPQTAADRAGLQVGDIVTTAGEYDEPAPALVRRAFDDTAEGGAVLLAITRNGARRLVVLTR